MQIQFSEAFVCLLYLYQCLFRDLLYNEGEAVDDTNVKMHFCQGKPESAATTLIQHLSQPTWRVAITAAIINNTITHILCITIIFYMYSLTEYIQHFWSPLLLLLFLLSVYNIANSPVTHWTHWYQPLPWPITSKNLQWRCAKDCRLSLKSGRLGHHSIHITESFPSPLVMLSWPSLSTFALPFIKQNRAWDGVTVSAGQGYSWICAALCMFMVKVLLNYEILPDVFWQIWPNRSRQDDINESPCLTDKVLAVSAALFFFLPPTFFPSFSRWGWSLFHQCREVCSSTLRLLFACFSEVQPGLPVFEASPGIYILLGILWDYMPSVSSDSSSCHLIIDREKCPPTSYRHSWLAVQWFFFTMQIISLHLQDMSSSVYQLLCSFIVGHLLFKRIQKLTRQIRAEEKLWLEKSSLKSNFTIQN